MEPNIGRLAFNLVIFIILFTVMPLLFLPRDSPEFIVSILALIVGLIFLTIITWDVRKQVRRTKPLGE